MSTFMTIVLSLLVGYFAGLLLGVGLVLLNSTRSDRQQEAAMTGFFVTGPLGAILCVVVELVFHVV